MSRAVWNPESMNVPWVESPFFSELLAQANLSAADAELARKYANDGFVIIDTGLDEKTMDGIVDGLAPRYRSDPTSRAGVYADDRRVQNAWQFLDPVKRLAALPRILDLLRVLYRRDPIPFQTLNFRIGSEQRIHSDTIHFHCFPHRFMCGAWVALEDVDENNGPLRYYPGSHKLPIWDMHDIGYVGTRQTEAANHYVQYEDFVERMLASTSLEPVEIRVKRGQALIWSANLFHGGSPIRDPKRTRQTQVTHYYFSGGVYYTPMYSDSGLGRYKMRRIRDIRDGSVVPQAYNGESVGNPGGWPAVLESDPVHLRLNSIPQRASTIVSRGYAALKRLRAARVSSRA